MKSLCITNDEYLQQQIAAICAARTPLLAVSMTKGRFQHAAKLLMSDLPQLVMLDATDIDSADFLSLEKFNAQYPQVAVMLLTPDQSPEFLMRALRAGVREVVTLPLEHASISDALDRIANKAQFVFRQGRILSFISCKGGSGATYLATNFGHALATMAKKKVLLIDLNQQFGDALLYVSDKKPAMTLSDVCVQIDRLDAAFLESCLVEVAPNFGILAASDDPARSTDITPEHIDTILRLARNCYDYILLDVGRQIDAVTIRALDNADVIQPVLQLALPYIRDGRRLLDIFRSLGYSREKIRLIVNRYDAGGNLRLADLEAVLGKVEYTVPNSYAPVSDSINQGVPILRLARHGAVAKSLLGMVGKTTGVRETEGKGFIVRLFNRGLQLGDMKA